jgi:hypothetical protein
MPNTAKTAMTAAFWTTIPKMMNITLTTTVMTAAAWYRFEFVALSGQSSGATGGSRFGGRPDSHT